MEIVTNSFEFLENGLGISLVVFFPLVSALVVALLPKKQELLILFNNNILSQINYYKSAFIPRVNFLL